MITIINKDRCSGCHACSNICPQNCIYMVPDNEGFLYPKVDVNNCINCNMCVRACPILKENNPICQNKIYACYNKDEYIRIKSSSGGIFSLIAEEIINKKGVVFGAGFDQNFNIVHLCIDSVKDIEKLRGSKYVQSEIGDSYKKAKEFLQEGRMVLFTGTPCQIAGLKEYLGENYKKLITQDIICHGVPSPKVWQRYLSYQKKIAGSSVRKISFRQKNEGWKRYSVSVSFENNTEYRKNLTEDLFMRGFLQDLYLRPSCYNCHFKTISRCSDFTLADFWGIENMLPEMNDDKGTSLMLIHSDKGEQIFNLLSNKIISKEVDLDQSLSCNPSVCNSVNINYVRDKFFDDIDQMTFDVIIEKYCGASLASRLRRKLSKYLNY